ncbi:MAG: pseudouridine synthase [Phycisphaerales bacterium]|nr:pseudouridine synthase [Phycisphaerales bacterium]
MSKKNTSNSYFEKTFGKAAKSEHHSEETKGKKDFGDKGKPISKDKKTDPKGRFEARDRKSFDRKEGDAPRRRFDKEEGKPFERRERSDAPRKSFDRKEGDAPRRRFDDKEGKPFERKERSDAPRKSFDRKEGDAPRRKFEDKAERPFDRNKKPFSKNEGGHFKKDNNNRKSNFDSKEADEERKPQRNSDNQTVISRDNQVQNVKIGAHLKPHKQSFDEEGDFEEDLQVPEKAPEKMPLNKYIAHCGICSRRDAVEYIKQGKVKVNGVLVEEPGLKINEGDAVTVAGKKIVPQKNLAYLLLNKPKGFITTTEDEKGRKTIMDLVASSEIERLYPIGRLDRNTTGLIILTNDGELAQKLSHPKYNVKKIYQVTLDKHITKADFEKILAGVTLEDGLAPVDSLAMLEEKNELGIEIHSGKNRIVRRIFEHLGYQVEKLDRVMYAGLTKKNLPRGKWRLLTEREVILLKHFKI